MNEQQDRLEQYFDEWKGSLPQVDDVIVIGSADDANLAREVSMAAVMTLFDEE